MKVKVLKAFKDRSQDKGPFKMYLPGEVVDGRTAEYALANGCGEKFVEEKIVPENKVAPEVFNKALDGRKTKR